MKFRTIVQFLVVGTIFLTPAIAGAITINPNGSFSWTINAVQLTSPDRWEYFIDPQDLREFRGSVDYDNTRLDLTLDVNGTVTLLSGYATLSTGPQLGHTPGAGTGISTIDNISGQNPLPPATPVDIFQLTFLDLTPADPSIPRITFRDSDGDGPDGYILTTSSTGQTVLENDFTGATIPEPGTLTLLCLGLFGLLFRRRS